MTAVSGAAFGLADAAHGAEPQVSHLKLREKATVTGETVRLRDILIFSDGDQQVFDQVADQPVSTGPTWSCAQTRLLISHQQVTRRLDELGVNLSGVLVGGALTCEVTQQVPSSSEPPGAGEGQAEEPKDTGELGEAGKPVPTTGPESVPAGAPARTPQTLGDLLRAQVRAELAQVSGTPEIEFERASQQLLRLTSPPWDFQIVSSGGGPRSGAGGVKLGPREFRVLIRRDGQVQRRVDVFAQVRLVRPVVVAQGPLNPGNFVRRQDVTLETRVFDQGDRLGLTRLEEVIGQQVKRFVPAGEMVSPDAIKPVDLVSRSRPVTVIGERSGVQVRLVGVALDDGGYGETVRVRLGESRGQRQVLQGVVAGLGTVRLFATDGLAENGAEGNW